MVEFLFRICRNKAVYPKAEIEIQPLANAISSSPVRFRSGLKLHATRFSMKFGVEQVRNEHRDGRQLEKDFDGMKEVSGEEQLAVLHRVHH